MEIIRQWYSRLSQWDPFFSFDTTLHRENAHWCLYCHRSTLPLSDNRISTRTSLSTVSRNHCKKIRVPKITIRSCGSMNLWTAMNLPRKLCGCGEVSSNARVEWNRVRKIKYARFFKFIHRGSFYFFLLSRKTLTKWGYGIFLFFFLSFCFVFENEYLRSVVKSSGILSYREIYAWNLKILCICKAEVILETISLWIRNFYFFFFFMFWI